MGSFAVPPLETLRVSILVTMLAASGCGRYDSEKQPMTQTSNLATTTYEVCGHKVRIQPPRLLNAEGRASWHVRQNADGLAITIPMAAIGAEPGGQALRGVISAYTTCSDQGGGLWAKGGPEQKEWEHITPRPELGLIEYAGLAGQSTPGPVYASAGSYRKPDGSPFTMQCDAGPDAAPLACNVIFELAAGLYVSYRYYTENALHRWQEIDLLVTAVITKE